MKTRIVFEASFDRIGITGHRCEVHVHSSLGALRRILKMKYRQTDNKDTLAFHWGADKPGRDRVTSMIHLPLQAGGVYMSHIIHECVHAGFHRAYLLGFQFNDPSFEEVMAKGTEDLSMNIQAKLEGLKIQVLKK